MMGSNSVDQFMTETSPESVSEGLASQQLPGTLDVASTLGGPTAATGSSATQSASSSKGSRSASLSFVRLHGLKLQCCMQSHGMV